jgi:hypothetical protein
MMTGVLRIEKIFLEEGRQFWFIKLRVDYQGKRTRWRIPEKLLPSLWENHPLVD